MTGKPFAPACERNREPILAVIEPALASVGARRVLEIGSGTGQHAVYFAAAMPWLEWTATDRKVNHEGIRLWLEAAGCGNVVGPLELDVLEGFDRLEGPFDAVFSANTAHIMSWHAVEAMFRGVGALLRAGGLFLLYGPFNRGGACTSESNRAFDASLRAGDPDMGIRDLERVETLAGQCGMRLRHVHRMPANNLILEFAREDAPDGQ